MSKAWWPCVLLLLLFPHLHREAAASPGAPPLVIARGGASGLFPEQTAPAYMYALNYSLPPIALFCDVQFTKDALGFCRTNLDLSNSTLIANYFPNGKTTYVVNGVSIEGWFSIDYTLDFIRKNLTATQPVQTRTNAFDGDYPILTPEMLSGLIAQFTNDTGSSAFSWLNIQYAKFYQQHNINVTSYVLSLIRNYQPQFVSSPEVGLLTTLQTTATKVGTKLILQLLQPDVVDPSTNQTYGALLNNLTYIKSFASGILVPKSYVLPVNNSSLYLEPATSLVQAAHRLKLAIYALGFGNDFYPLSYNYSFDPIKEYRSFIDNPAAAVDGILSDFPTTASDAIACYNMNLLTAPGTAPAHGTKSLVISHNGASGDFPGCTKLSYLGAINDGADYIDCPVQMTADGVPICLDFADLQIGTNVASTPFFYRQQMVPQIQPTSGVFTFNLTWSEISTLKAVQYSPEGKDYNIFRNPTYDLQQGILRLSDFLELAGNHSSVGIYIDIQNAYFLEASKNINALTAVTSVLKQAGLSNSTNILLVSEDINALRQLKQTLPYKLIYKIASPTGVFVTLSNSVVAEIKQVADGVEIPRVLITPYDQNSYYFLYNSPGTVELLHSFNLTVYASSLKNEFVALASDYQSDPSLELSTLIQFHHVDGVRTDFPATAKAYINNLCTQTNSKATQPSYSFPYVTPGSLLGIIPGYVPPPMGAPAPSFSVAEPPFPTKAPGSNAPQLVPAPSQRSSATQVLPCLIGAIIATVVCLLQLSR